MEPGQQIVGLTSISTSEYPIHSSSGSPPPGDRPPSLPTDIPPYSRIFVVCGKSTTEDELVEQFKNFGTIDYCKLLKDKQTGEPKGLAYVKFTKASSAARAIEETNDQQPWEDRPPLKVTLAEAKGTPRGPRIVSREPEDTPPQSRLFVLCSKETTEEDLDEIFRAYGHLEYTKVMRDRETNEPKGFAFVKFAKASTAAAAMEEVNEQEREVAGSKLKVMIAEPKAKKTAAYTHGMYTARGAVSPYGVAKGAGASPTPEGIDPRFLYYPYPYSPYLAGPPPVAPNTAAETTGVPAGSYAGNYAGLPAAGAYLGGRQRLYVVCGKAVTREELYHLFSYFPGLEYVDLKHQRETGESKGFAYVSFATPQAALYAKEQLDGYEFPTPGNRLKVIFADPLKTPARGTTPPPAGPASPATAEENVHHSISNNHSHARSNGHNGNSYNNHSHETNGHIAHHATNGHHYNSHHHHNNTNGSTSNGGGGGATTSHYPEGSRLFVSLVGPMNSTAPVTVPEYMLQELFSRFGGLEYVRLLKGKSFGYAKYTSAEAARQAMQMLHGTDVAGMKLRVELARPMRQSGGGSSGTPTSPASSA